MQAQRERIFFFTLEVFYGNSNIGLDEGLILD